MNDWEVWKYKDHVCIACGKDLDKDTFEVYYRDENPDNKEMSNIDLICGGCHEKLDKNSRGQTELIFEEIEEEMPDASPEEKTMEYLRRSEE